MTALFIIVVISVVGSLLTALSDSIFGYCGTSKLANCLHDILVAGTGMCVGIFAANNIDAFRF